MDAKEALRRVLRVDSLVVTTAVLVHLAAGATAAAVMAAEGEPDWILYGLMGLLTAVVLTNYGRLGSRVTLFRRASAGLFAISVVAAWGALIADRIHPALHVSGRLDVGADRPLLLVAVGLEAIVVGLLGFHVVVIAPRTRRHGKARRAEALAAREALGAARAARDAALQEHDEEGDV